MRDLERLRERSAVLTEGFPDVKVRGDQYGWYVRVAVKPPRARDRLVGASNVDLQDALVTAWRKVEGL